MKSKRAFIARWSLAFWVGVVAILAFGNALLDDQTMWAREDAFISASNYSRFHDSPGTRFFNRQTDAARHDDGDTQTRPVRIVVIGDSFVWGDGAVDSEMRWPQQLQRVLDSRYGPDRFLVTSMANNGASTANQVAWVGSADYRAMRPDAVVVGYVSNDPVPPGSKAGVCDGFWCYGIRQYEVGSAYTACVRGSGSWFAVLTHGLAYPAPAVARNLNERYCTIRGRAGSDESGYTYFDWIQRLLKPDSLRQYEKTARALASRTDATRASLFVMPTPVRPSEFALARQPLEILSRAGATIVPSGRTKSLVTSQTPGSLKINPANAHPSPLLARVYARDVAEALGSRLAPPERGGRAKGEETREIVNFIPTYLSVRQQGSTILTLGADRGAAVDVPTSRYQVAGRQLPPQTTLCALLGRPYAQLAFRAKRVPIRHISARLTAEIPFGIATFGYSDDGREVSSRPVTALAGDRTVLALPAGVEVAGVRMWPTDRIGCPLEETIELPNFGISLTVTRA